MERLGFKYFEELLLRSFFQHAPNDKSLFVMHDLMNDLATSVAGDVFSRSDIKMKKEVRKEPSEKYRHMSLVCEDYIVHQKLKAFKGARVLRTFLALSSEGIKSRHIFHLSNKVLDDLLHELPLLRVLYLSHLTISEVPESIGSLKHLRYLNLRRTKIRNLPENVCRLYNLQTLIVSGCYNLVKLPESFSKLKNLQHFDFRNTPLLKKMPLGIGELKSLRTLYGIVIEVQNGFSITELKYLKDLRGEISIKGLDKVQNPIHAHEANLSQKRLSRLELEWTDVFDDFRKETLEKEVLNLLKPHNDCLKRLEIVSYGGIEFPKWVGDPSFIRLTNVTIHGCTRCTELPELGQLPSLKELFIQCMDGVRIVGLGLLGNGHHAFPSLERLGFLEMDGWEVWSTNSGVHDRVFPCLQELSLHGCPNLIDVSLEALPSLRVLRVSGCGHEVLRSLVRVASSVAILGISNISGLDDRQWGGVIEYLGEVEELRIEHCSEISYLWQSEAEASMVLMNLGKLVVCECENLVSLGEEEEDYGHGSYLTSLRILEVQQCNELKCCRCPNSIESLNIRNCDSITSISLPTGGQKLKSVIVEFCEKLMEKELGEGEENRMLINNTSMLMLESVEISYLPNLKSIVELSRSIHLTSLSIKDCPNMESFPDHELPNLTALKNLRITNCPSTEASFPCGLWPPKLCLLIIGRLKKPISEWGPQKFPTSLVDLRLMGGPSEDVSDFSRLSQLVPSSLTSLGIYEFEKLESLKMGLQHLTSLQRLAIDNCPKTKDLPDMLLSSLLSLRIFRCPNLKERISTRRGSYWPLVSLIPCINID